MMLRVEGVGSAEPSLLRWLRLKERSARRLALLALTTTAAAQISLSALADRADPGTEFRLALLALAVPVGMAPVLVVTHLRWWLRARRRRQETERDLAVIESQGPVLVTALARAGLRRLLVCFLVSLGWVLVAGLALGSSSLLEASGHQDLSSAVFEAAGWAMLAAVAASFVLLGLLARQLVRVGFDALGGAAVQADAMAPPGGVGPWLEAPSHRHAQWISPLAWTLSCGLYLAMLTVSVGLWRPPDLILVALLALAAATMALGAGMGWWYDLQDRRTA